MLVDEREVDRERESEIRAIQEATEDVVRALTAARGQVEQLRSETTATASEVDRVLGGTATGADRETIDRLNEAGDASWQGIDTIDDAIRQLFLALERL